MEIICGPPFDVSRPKVGSQPQLWEPLGILDAFTLNSNDAVWCLCFYLQLMQLLNIILYQRSCDLLSIMSIFIIYTCSLLKVSVIIPHQTFSIQMFDRRSGFVQTSGAVCSRLVVLKWGSVNNREFLGWVNLFLALSSPRWPFLSVQHQARWVLHAKNVFTNCSKWTHPLCTRTGSLIFLWFIFL